MNGKSNVDCRMRHNDLTIKTKIALTVSILFVLFATGLMLFAVGYYGRLYKSNIANQQYMLVSSVADSIDDKLNILLRALDSGADGLPLHSLNDAEKIQQYLDARHALRALYDNGLFLISRDGRLIAESPYLPNRRGRDVSFRDFFKKTVATGKPQISDPYISTHNPGRPAVMLTVPIFDSRGELVAILAGSLDLLGKNILYGIGPFKTGKDGYIYISDCNRIIILHPDRERIMNIGAPPGVNRMYDRAVAGFEGSGETVSSKGMPQIFSARHLRTAKWFVAATFPLSEAYAPLKKGGIYFVSAITAGTVMMLMIVWLLMRRMTRPLERFARHAESLPEKPSAEKFFSHHCSDEIGTLAGAFNEMILELERRENSLRESEQRYRAVFENTHAVMMLIDGESGGITDANPAACAFYGYSKSQLTEKKVTDINTLPSTEVHGALRAAYKNEKHHHLLRHLCADGSIKDVEAYCGPVQVNGRGMVFSIIHDVTARKRAEDAFQESHRLLEHILASLNEAVFIVDSATTLIRDCNDTVTKMFGYSRDQIIGRSTTCLHLNEANAEWFRSELKRGYERMGYAEFLYQMKRADGTVFPSEHFATPIRDDDGIIRSHICVVRDITERKRVEDEFRRLNELLEQRVSERTSELMASNRELESFCYSVSHDLRSPLRGIDGFCSILQEDYADKLDGEGREYLNRISAAAVRMGQLIDDLLNLSRMTRTELVYDMVDLSQMATIIIADYQQLDPERIVQFEAAAGVTAKADRHLIRVVLENLLGNAWKFSSKQHGARIEFGRGESDGESWYFVSDNGVGFDMEYAHKLFKPFQRLHDAVEFPGTGIGLASVQRIVGRHGGRVWLNSQPNQGTTIYFTLAD